MNLLLEIFNSLYLTESVSTNSVADAIENKYRVTINYEGDPRHGVAPGIRTIEAYVYGLTKAGNPVIRAYQPYGDTASRVPDWKFFRLDRITYWEPTHSLITRPAPKFNPNGDRLMKTVYKIADFTKKSTDSNITGPKQTYKPIGQLSNIDKILADREREKLNKKEQEREISSFKKKELPNKSIEEPKISGEDDIEKQMISEPEIQTKETPTTNEPRTRQVYNPIGQLSNIDQILADREKEKLRKKEQEREISRFNKPETPKELGKPEILKPQIKEPEVKTDKTFKTKGDEELNKIKDLNRRLDNVKKIDLSKIPRK